LGASLFKKLQLKNIADNCPGFHAPALIVIHNSRQDKKQRHFGMDAEIQAMDGNM
jgi:hypothetical protein